MAAQGTKSGDVIVRIEEQREVFDPIGEFPKVWFHTEEEYKKVFEYLEIFVKATRMDLAGEDDSNPLLKSLYKGGGVTCANKVFALFLTEVKDYIKKEFYGELVFFLMMYRRAMNEEGYKKLAELKVKFESQSTEFCENYSAEYLPEISNEFILGHLQKYLEEYKNLPLVWLGTDDERMKNAVFFTHHFCSWLYGNRFTRSKISLDLDAEAALDHH